MTINRISIILMMILYGCDLIDYHQLDGRVKTDIPLLNQINIDEIVKITESKDTVRFVFMGDTHRNDKETEAFVKHVNSKKNIDFVIHAGDISDFGLKNEYELTQRLMSNLNYPYIVLLGNHDIIAHGDLIYKKVFGPENFSFIVGDTKFICVNTNALEYKNPPNIPDIQFINDELERGEALRTIFVMHSPPCGDQFYNENDYQEFESTIQKFPNLLCCLYGHNHQFKESELFNDGVVYYGCDNIQKRSYLLFKLYSEGYDYEYIKF